MATAASRTMSPGGALLRSSRLFSLPAPLPAHSGDYASATKFSSDSATRPYPTAQAITTPETSRQRGDWGFKRPLPLKTTTKSSDPFIRLNYVDSIESVTDFKSSADHTLMLEKFHEMNLPISVPSDKVLVANAVVPEKSVFEEDMDFTAADPGKEASSANKRWKFRGPWLAGMTEGDFNNYLKKQVRKRRSEFRQFMREQLATEMTQAAREKAMDQAETSGNGLPTVSASSITDEQLTAYLRRLRQDRAVLYNMVGRFLDLAPVQPASSLSFLGSLMPQTVEFKGENPYAKQGPPVTHPSAGISYLRTASYLDNHPVYGPQQTHAPVKARILQPRNGPFAARLGIAGLVADIPHGSTAFHIKRIGNRTQDVIPGLNTFDFNTSGGSKVYVQPASAKVDSQGLVVLKVVEASEEATVVKKELAGEAKIFGETPKRHEQPVRETRMRRFHGGTKMMSSSSNYGLKSSI